MATRDEITKLYIGYFNRAPDPIGLNYWLTQDEMSLAEIAESFSVQDEAVNLYPFLKFPQIVSPSAFLEQVYQNLFNRSIDEAGEEYWLEQLAGGRPVGEMIIDIISGAQDDDLTIIENKVDAGLAWTTAVASIAGFEYDDAAAASAVDVIDGVDATPASVVEAEEKVADFVEEITSGDTGGASSVQFFGTGGIDPVTGEYFTRDNLVGTSGDDTFIAEDGDLVSGDRAAGGGGDDTIMAFMETNELATSPITTGVENFVLTNQSNDNFDLGDNNVGGYPLGDGFGGFSFGPSMFVREFGFDAIGGVDVEIDAGRMSGVTWWESYDSRADVIIEDARDSTPEDGTFTADITAAMVSTDPGNVDFAIYFDDPVNTSSRADVIFIEVIDQNNSDFHTPGVIDGDDVGNLTDARLIEFTFVYNGEEVNIVLPTVEDQPELFVTGGGDLPLYFGETASYNDLVEVINWALTDDASPYAGEAWFGDLSATLSDQEFEENIGNDNDAAGVEQLVFGRRIEISSEGGATLEDAGAGDILVESTTDPADTAQSITAAPNVIIDCIRLDVVLDDVGKGGAGGDFVAGAMATGSQFGDQAKDDNVGIECFDIYVDRTSNLQTINSTNNTLEEVHIMNRDNDTARGDSDSEAFGDLIVRGKTPGAEDLLYLEWLYREEMGRDFEDDAEFDEEFFLDLFGLPVPSNQPMPGAFPQHNWFGFSDVRKIDASMMEGSVDFTLELTEEVVEKYLDIQDDDPNGEADDVLFDYDGSNQDDEMLIVLSADGINAAGTGSREDFDLEIDGNGGNDVITTNIGASLSNGVELENFFFDADPDFLIGFGVPGALKLIDEQGQDYFWLNSQNAEGWYENTVFNTAASFTVDGGAGDDTLYTHGWGDFEIIDGTGNDVVYTDNSGAVQLSELATNIDRNLLEHDQIDYDLGAAWMFNAEALDTTTEVFEGAALGFPITGATNDWIVLADDTSITSLGSGFVDVDVWFKGANGDDDTWYKVTASIPVSQLNLTSGGDIRVREQAVNQAIKEAINNDFVMSAVLEAADGPGNSLVVYSKIDGDFNADDLFIEFTGMTINGNNFSPSLDGSAYDIDNASFFNFGDASDAESDNVIDATSDNDDDVFVLSTSDDANFGTDLSPLEAFVNGDLIDPATDLNGASNETIEFDDDFGVDTIFNFDTDEGEDGTNNADDVLDFSAITGGSNDLGTFTSDGDDVVIDTVATVDTNNDGVISASEVVAYFGNNDDTTASTHVAIFYDSTGSNGGEVWKIVDGAGSSSDAVATEEGTIQLIGTSWASIDQDNIA